MEEEFEKCLDANADQDSKKILIALMTCKNSEKYIFLEEFARNAWGKDVLEGKCSNIKLVFYDFGSNDLLQSYYNEKENKVYVSNLYRGQEFIDDNFFSTTVKTMNFFKFICNSKEFEEYDIIYKGNTSTIVNVKLLANLCKWIPKNTFDIYCGTCYLSETFTGQTGYRHGFFHACGNSIIYSKALIKKILQQDFNAIEHNEFDLRSKYIKLNSVQSAIDFSKIQNVTMTDDLFLSCKIRSIAKSQEQSIYEKMHVYNFIRNFDPESGKQMLNLEDLQHLDLQNYIGLQFIANNSSISNIEEFKDLQKKAYEIFYSKIRNVKYAYDACDIYKKLLKNKKEKIEYINLAAFEPILSKEEKERKIEYYTTKSIEYAQKELHIAMIDNFSDYILQENNVIMSNAYEFIVNAICKHSNKYDICFHMHKEKFNNLHELTKEKIFKILHFNDCSICLHNSNDIEEALKQFQK